MSYRYIGNKTRLAGTILDVIGRYIPPPATVADPMCGTASMSAALRARGYDVIASDIMTFAIHNAQVRLKLSAAPDFAGIGLSYSEILSTLNTLPPSRGLFFREYGSGGTPESGSPSRRYLIDANASLIDAIRERLLAWSTDLSELEQVLLRHDLVLALNRVANIAGTYGHYRSSWSSGAIRPLRLLPTKFEPGRTDSHVVLQGPVERLASEISAEACYLDPPYMKRQYAANYHLPETVARGDEPEPVGSSGLRNWWDQYSDFCSKRNIADAFAAIFEKMDCPLFFVSYSDDGLLPRGAMTRLFNDFGAVELYEFYNKRFRSNRGGVGGKVTELLYVVKKSF